MSTRRFAYADPPYLCAAHLYKHAHSDWQVYATLAGHRGLIDRLVDDFPDGWALSMSSSDIQHVSPLLPVTVRWGAWVKPFGSFKPGISPAYVWEPVAYHVPNRPKHDRGRPTIRDFLIEEGPAIRESIALKKGLAGAKPERFCSWILDILGWTPEDDLVDIFPGTGVMGRVVQSRREQTSNAQLRLEP